VAVAELGVAPLPPVAPMAALGREGGLAPRPRGVVVVAGLVPRPGAVAQAGAAGLALAEELGVGEGAALPGQAAPEALAPSWRLAGAAAQKPTREAGVKAAQQSARLAPETPGKQCRNPVPQPPRRLGGAREGPIPGKPPQ
jgi:hypothetical protein